MLNARVHHFLLLIVLISCGNKKEKHFSFREDVKKVIAVSYQFPREAVEFANEIETSIIANDKIGFNHFHEQITLNNEQIDSLEKILITGKTNDHWLGADCYWPRHCIYFMGEDDKVIGYFEICFECSNFRTNKDELRLMFEHQVPALTNFFKWVGIKKGYKGREEDVYPK